MVGIHILVESEYIDLVKVVMKRDNRNMSEVIRMAVIEWLLPQLPKLLSAKAESMQRAQRVIERARVTGVRLSVTNGALLCHGDPLAVGNIQAAVELDAMEITALLNAAEAERIRERPTYHEYAEQKRAAEDAIATEEDVILTRADMLALAKRPAALRRRRTKRI